MTTFPSGLRRLCARADAARRTAERLETGDEVLTPLLADLDGLDLVSGRWIEPLLSFADGSSALERLLEPSPPSPLPPHRSPSPGEGRHLPPVDRKALQERGFEERKALGERVPPPLGGGAVGSGGGQVGGSPAKPHPPAPSPISHPAPRRERGRTAEEREGVERTSKTAETKKEDRHSSALFSPFPEPGGISDANSAVGEGLAPSRAGGNRERETEPSPSRAGTSLAPTAELRKTGKPPTWPPPLPTTPRPGGEEKDFPATSSPLSRGGGEEGRERGARGVRASLGDVLQRLDSSRGHTPSPISAPSAPTRELPGFPDTPPSLGGLRGLAALASQAEEPSSPAPPPPEPAVDDLAERLERLLRREAHRHGIEVEP